MLFHSPACLFLAQATALTRASRVDCHHHRHHHLCTYDFAAISRLEQANLTCGPVSHPWSGGRRGVETGGGVTLVSSSRTNSISYHISVRSVSTQLGGSLIWSECESPETEKGLLSHFLGEDAVRDISMTLISLPSWAFVGLASSRGEKLALDVNQAWWQSSITRWRCKVSSNSQQPGDLAY